jgi:putative SOS response-associated peptidase YedK
MCGRFALQINPDRLRDIFSNIILPDTLAPQPDHFPDNKSNWKDWQRHWAETLKTFSQRKCMVLSVTHNEEEYIGKLMLWGLLTPNIIDPGEFRANYSTYNAKAENLQKSKMYATPFKTRRCIIPATGFYEYSGAKSRRIPHFFTPKHFPIFSFAGLWETWITPDNTQLHTCTIITTEPNSVIKPIHHRMPVILSPEQYDTWLDKNNDDLVMMQKLLTPCPETLLQREGSLLE